MSTPSGSLPIPPHFVPPRVGEVWRVPYQQRADEAAAWAGQHGLQPAAEDQRRVGLLLVDCQNTFCIPGFELFVTGRAGNAAVEDNVRLCEFIYRNLGGISEIIATLDTHTALQIFHSAFLVDERGKHPPPMTTISLEDIERGRWKVSAAARANLAALLPGKVDLDHYLLHYCRTLSEGGKYELMVWPYHAMRGGIGHALVSAVEDACFFHALARQCRTRFEAKGGNPLTENYSVLRPEVLEGPEGTPIAAPNTALVDRLLGFDALVVAGQAKSHCVAWTLDDLLAEINARDPSLAEKVYLLEDCTSPVVVPGVIDFTEQADAAFERFAHVGMHRVHSTDPVHSWPDIA
jgi:nicotinamidase-related amidase